MACHFPSRSDMTWRSRSWAMDARKRSAKVLTSEFKAGLDSAFASIVIVFIRGSMVCAALHTSQENIHNDVGHAGERVIPITVRKHPGGDHFVHRPEEAVGGQFDGHVRTKDAALLAFLENTLNEVEMLHQQVVRKLGQKFRAVPQFGLKNNGQVAVRPQSFKMQKSHLAQLVARVGEFLQSGAGADDEAMEGRV